MCPLKSFCKHAFLAPKKHSQTHSGVQTAPITVNATSTGKVSIRAFRNRSHLVHPFTVDSSSASATFGSWAHVAH